MEAPLNAVVMIHLGRVNCQNLGQGYVSGISLAICSTVIGADLIAATDCACSHIHEQRTPAAGWQALHIQLFN